MSMKTEQRLKSILTSDHCGVALGFYDGVFILYQWGHAPVSSEILGWGKTIDACIERYDRWLDFQFDLKGNRIPGRTVHWQFNGILGVYEETPTVYDTKPNKGKRK